MNSAVIVYSDCPIVRYNPRYNPVSLAGSAIVIEYPSSVNVGVGLSFSFVHDDIGPGG